MLQVAQRVSLQALLESPVEFVKASQSFGQKSTVKRDATVKESRRASDTGDGLAEPRKVLFPANVLSQSWSKIMPAPPGLHNTGNTCFLNAVMQVLMHVPGLVTYLQSGQHGHACRLNHCTFCQLEQHGQKAYPAQGTKRGQPFRPTYTNNIKQIGKHFRKGRQEDAHEFLLLLLEQLQNNCLQGQAKTLDHRSKETTVVHRLFGGHLRQQITCSKCRVLSNTYEATLVLSLDCLSTVEQGLARLTTAEHLTGKNRYRCEACKTLQEARKQTTIFQPPENLIIHFKRFQYASKSSKINKPVTYEDTLDLTRFMTQGHAPVTYSLTGVVVHQGSGVNSGHYFAFGKAGNASWHEFNDESVSQAGLPRVLKQQAYMLVYTIQAAGTPKDTPTAAAAAASGTFSQLTGGHFGKRKHQQEGRGGRGEEHQHQQHQQQKKKKHNFN